MNIIFVDFTVIFPFTFEFLLENLEVKFDLDKKKHFLLIPLKHFDERKPCMHNRLEHCNNDKQLFFHIFYIVGYP